MKSAMTTQTDCSISNRTGSLIGRLLLASVLSAMLALTALASPGDPLRYQGGVRNSSGARRIEARRLSMIVKSLREKTGLVELAFDEDGFLRAGDTTRLIGGSETARRLLISALEGEAAFDLEIHNRSAEVAFARLSPPISYQSRTTGARIEVIPVEIDFADFERLNGDPQVLASFDVGMVLLHELAHGVLRLPDALGEEDKLGECEAHINQIRRELNLPERQHYTARLFERPSPIRRANTIQAELLFEHAPSSSTASPSAGRAKRKQYILSWAAAEVGQIRNETSLPRSRGGTLVMQ